MIPFTWNGRRERNLIRGPVSIVGSGLGGLQSRPLQSSLGLTDPRCWACGGCGVKSLGVVVEDSQEKITCPTSQAGGRGTVRTLMGRSLAVGSHSGSRPRASDGFSCSQEPHLSCPSHASVGVAKWPLTSTWEVKVGAKKSCSLSYHQGCVQTNLIWGTVDSFPCS